MHFFTFGSWINISIVRNHDFGDMTLFASSSALSGFLPSKTQSACSRTLCVDALVEAMDSNTDWKLDYHEFARLLDPNTHLLAKSESKGWEQWGISDNLSIFRPLGLYIPVIRHTFACGINNNLYNRFV